MINKTKGFTIEFRDNTEDAEMFDRCFGTHKFLLIPVYSPREEFIEAIKDLTPEQIQKVKEYAEFLHHRRTHK